MRSVKDNAVATVIGDVVDSRRHADRRALHDRLTDTLDLVNARLRPRTPLAITVGDEFQGTCATVGDALDVAFAVQVALAPEVQVRFGIGWGAVTVLDPARGTQDGPGWWAAREAIDAARSDASTPMLRSARTAYRSLDPSGPDEASIGASLLCRDHLVGSLDDRSLRILGSLMTDVSQHDIAAAEGISPSAVSQRVRRDGLGVIVAAQALLREVK